MKNAAGGGGIDYYEDEKSRDDHLRYYENKPGEEVPETNDKGEEIAFEAKGALGLELGLVLAYTSEGEPIMGITKAQAQELEMGRWNGEVFGKNPDIPGSGVRTGHRAVTNPSDTPPRSWPKDKDWGIFDPDKGHRVRLETDKDGNVVEKKVMEAHKTGLIDVPYGVPKSVTEAFVRASSEGNAAAIVRMVKDAAINAHEEAVENWARVARVNTGKNENYTGNSKAKAYGQARVAGAKMLYLPVVQFSNRDGQPHLHVHMPTFTSIMVEGRGLTMDEYDIKKTAEYRDAAFLDRVARGMEQLGYPLEYSKLEKSRNGKYQFETADSSKSLREFWSSDRPAEGRKAFFEKYGKEPSEVQLQRFLYATRPKKVDKEQDSNPDRQRWIDEANKAAAEAISKLKTPAAKAKAAKAWDTSPIEPGRAKEYSPLPERLEVLKGRLNTDKGLIIKDAVFTGNTIRPAIARLATDLGMTDKERFDFEEQFRQELIPVRIAADDRFSYYTTQTVLDMEEVITEIRQSKGDGYEAVPDHYIELAIKALPFTLDPDQRAAVVAGCKSSGWVHIGGPAGTGKSATLQGIVSAVVTSGVADEVIVASTAAVAAERTGKGLRGVSKWGSIDSIVGQIKSGKIVPSEKTLLVLDEAAMVNTMSMAKLLDAIGKARVVLVGDSEQLTPIGAGGWYAESIEAHGMHELRTVHRQRNEEDKRDYQLIREGRSAEALANMTERGRVHVLEDPSDKFELALEHYKLELFMGQSSKQIRWYFDGSNHDVDKGNRMIQSVLKAQGEIRGEGIEVHEPEQDRTWTIHEGDQMLFLDSYFEKTTDAIGRPKFTTIRNGTLFEVLKLNPETQRARIKLEDGRLETITIDKRSGVAYAQSVSKSQGGEVEIGQYFPSEGTNKNAAYPGVTRAKEATHVYLDYQTFGDQPGIQVANQWEKGVEKHTAHWHLEHKSALKSERLQEAQKDLVSFIDSRYDYSLAESIIGSDAFEALVVKADEMTKQGLDANAIIAEAIDQRELSTAEDTAKVILWRLENKLRTMEPEQTDEMGQSEDFHYDEDLMSPDLVARLRLADLNRNRVQEPQQQRTQDRGMSM